MAFMLAATHAFKDAFREAAPQIMEPLVDLEILCPNEVMGDIMSDLQTRRAMVLGMDTDGHYQKVLARAPQAELYLYSSTLRSISQGRAKFHQTFAEYQAVPQEIQQKLIEAHKHEEIEV
jgi:elongation factor G